MICNHCGKTLDNETLIFCTYCGYPLKETNKGFFTRSEETGTSAADDFAAQRPAPPSQGAPWHLSAAIQQEEVQNPSAMQTQTVPQPALPPPMQQSTSAQGMMSQMGMMPQPNMMAGMMQSMMMQNRMMQPPPPQQPAPEQQPEGMIQMQQAAYPMAGMMPQMSMMQSMMMPDASGNMVSGMPVMMGMPQFMGYDASGTPLYMQMMPQIMGYDAYGNPMYTMVPVSFSMPQMQSMTISQMQEQQQMMPGTTMQQGTSAVPEQQQSKPLHIASGHAASPQFDEKPRVLQPEPLPESSAPPPAFLQDEEPAAPKPVPEPEHVSKPKAVSEPEHVSKPKAVSEPEHVSAADTAEIPLAAEEEVPVSADSLIQEEQQQQMPDEQQLLDSIFGNKPKPKVYTMDETLEASSATFSINVSASEITSVRKSPKPKPAAAPKRSRGEIIFGAEEQQQPPPPQAMFESPSQAPTKSNSNYLTNPQNGQGHSSSPPYQTASPMQPSAAHSQNISQQYQTAVPMQPAPGQSNSLYRTTPPPVPNIPPKSARVMQNAPEPEPVSAPPPPPPEKKSSKKQKSKSGKGGIIVDAAEFFGDAPKVKQKGVLNAALVQNMSDEQLAERLAQMQSGGRKKSRRSMKSATDAEADLSNMSADAIPPLV